jgi:hypothetical protein
MRRSLRVGLVGLSLFLAGAAPAAALTPAEISRMGARAVVGWDFPHGPAVQIHLTLPLTNRRPSVVVNDCNFDPAIKGSTRRPANADRIYGYLYYGRTDLSVRGCGWKFLQSTDYTHRNRVSYAKNLRRAFRQVRLAVDRDLNRGQTLRTERFHVPLKGLRTISSLVQDPVTKAIRIGAPVGAIRLLYRASSPVASVVIASDGCAQVQLRSPPGFAPIPARAFCGRHM